MKMKLMIFNHFHNSMFKCDFIFNIFLIISHNYIIFLYIYIMFLYIYNNLNKYKNQLYKKSLVYIITNPVQVFYILLSIFIIYYLLFIYFI